MYVLVDVMTYCAACSMSLRASCEVACTIALGEEFVYVRTDVRVVFDVN